MNPEPQDVLLVWNRHGTNDAYAARYEAAGARVIVAENGYIGTDENDDQLYALALHHHLGAGEWKEGPEDRWSRLGIELKPWRTKGHEIVVLPQRGIGSKTIAMPGGWTEDVVRRLKKITDRPVRVRLHPGMSRTDPWVDLQDAWAAVTWASGAGIKAIVYGVPVFHELASWIGHPAARFGISDVERPFLSDRLPMLRRLAWSQWKLSEVSSGEPFRHLLG
ncbi:MAG: hypothetical protein ACYCZ0_00075 [Minisyncoccota bacterium]